MVDLTAGETVTCTFYNSRDVGEIIIVKEADPADNTVFDFTEDIPGPESGFTLTDPADNTVTFTSVPTGSYAVTETGEAGWTLDDIACDDPDSSGDEGAGTATIDLDKDEQITCTFSNSRDTGTVVIVKEADPADDTEFDFTENIHGGGGLFTLSDPSDFTETFNDVPTGSYNVNETSETGWTLDDIACDDLNSSGNTGTGQATINLEKDETVTCTFYNSKIAPPPTADIFVSATEAGETDDGVVFGPHDILQWDGSGWSKWFNGTAAGLAPSGKFKHDINAVWIPDPAGNEVWISFTQNDRIVPDITTKVDGMDLVAWNGIAFVLAFDGQDVGLTNKTEEKIDALHVLPGASSPIGAGCLNYLLVSTQGPGKVPNHSGGTLNFGGEDVLGFCQTGVGVTTTGLWHMVLDGSAQGMPKNATDSISLSADGNVLYLTTKGAFNVDTATGGHSMVYAYDLVNEEFFGPLFVAASEGLPKKVDGLQVVGGLP